MNLSMVTKGEISPLDFNTRIDDLMTQMRNLDGFVTAIQKLRSVIVNTFSESENNPKIIVAFETARRTLRGAGVCLFEWAECPPLQHLHKVAYLDALRTLHARKGSFAPEYKRRLHILLMPLTSNFKFVQSREATEIVSGEKERNLTVNQHGSPERVIFPSLEMGTATSSMPPPAISRVRVMQLESSYYHRSRSIPRSLRYAEDIESNRNARRRRRSESPAGRLVSSSSSSSSNEYTDDDQENQPELQVYRAPRAFGKFGIYCTGKSSMHSRSGQRSNRSERQISTASVRSS